MAEVDMKVYLFEGVEYDVYCDEPFSPKKLCEWNDIPPDVSISEQDRIYWAIVGMIEDGERTKTGRELLNEKRNAKRKLERATYLSSNASKWYNTMPSDEVKAIMDKSRVCVDLVFKDLVDSTRVPGMAEYLKKLYLVVKSNDFQYSQVRKFVPSGYADLVGGKLLGSDASIVALWRHFYTDKKVIKHRY